MNYDWSWSVFLDLSPDGVHQRRGGIAGAIADAAALGAELGARLRRDAEPEFGFG